jgi:hypothetical protein
MASELPVQQLPNGVNGINGASTNGSHGTNNFSLTEYSAMPSPPSEEPRKAKAKVPEDLLDKDGNPDVSPQALEPLNCMRVLRWSVRS